MNRWQGIKRWVSGFLGGDSWDPPARLVDVSAHREPSPYLLRELRNLDPRAEAVYLGEGRWWVGRVKAESPRRKHGRALALRSRENDGFNAGTRWPELRQGLLMAQGFGLCCDLTVPGDPDGRLIREFEKFLATERGHHVVDEEQALYDKVARDIASAQADRERDLNKWLFRRGGISRKGLRGVGAGSNTPTGRPI